MKCPRCQAVFAAVPDPAGTVLCSSCGARLRTRAPAPEAAEPRRPGPRRDTGPALARVAAVATAAAPQVRPAPHPTAEADAALADTLRQLLAEMRAIRETQQGILALLQGSPGPSADLDPAALFDRPAPASRPTTVRSGRRKSVLIVDDEESTRQAAVAAFEAAEVPVRAVGDGNAALAAIAGERPDVVVLELAMGGSMAGKDVVNMIKATMEWVDIPLVAYTRLPIASQKEARQIHGADELVNKSASGAEALVQRVIALFRRG